MSDDPTPMPTTQLLARDRAYLRDFVRFGHMNHVVAAEALRRAYAEADSTAAAVHQQTGRLSREDAQSESLRLNTGARVQTIAVARLMSEYAAAIEDLAGMIHAAGARTDGVLRSYLLSEPAQTGAVIKAMAEDGDILGLARLPDPSTAPGLAEAAREMLTQSLSALAGTLKQAADAARAVPAAEGTSLADVGQDKMVLVLDVGEPVRKPPHGVLFQAHNRIKHRFMVVEDLAALGGESGEAIRFAHVPRSPDVVRTLVSNITQVSLATAELAAMLLAWDEAATPPDD